MRRLRVELHHERQDPLRLRVAQQRPQPLLHQHAYCEAISTVESVLLADIKDRLLSRAAIAEVVRRTQRLMEAAQAPKGDYSRSASLRREIANLTDAIASGLLRSSPALAERLHRTEAELARLELKAAEPSAKALRVLPKVAQDYRAMVDDMANLEAKDVTHRDSSPSRRNPRSTSPDGTHLEAAVPEFAGNLFELAAGNRRSIKELENGVAGARFGHSLRWVSLR